MKMYLHELDSLNCQSMLRSPSRTYAAPEFGCGGEVYGETDVLPLLEGEGDFREITGFLAMNFKEEYRSLEYITRRF